MSRIIKKGATSQSIYLEVLDSTSTTGGRKTGLAYNTASLVAYYARNGASPVAITLATLAAANSAWSSGGFKEVDSANMPGLYRLDLPNAALASGADSVVVTLRGASGMVQVSSEIQLTAIDLQDAAAAGMTNLDAAVSSRLASGSYSAAPSAAAIRAEIDSNSTKLDVAVSTRLASAGYTAPLDAAGVRTAVGLGSANLDTQLGAIRTRTDALPSDPADASDIAAAFGTVNSTLSTLSGYVDTEVAAIKAKTDQLAFSGGNVLADLRAISTAPVAVDTGTAGTVSFVSGAYVATAGGTVQANVVQIDGENVVSDGNGRIGINTSEAAAAVRSELTTELGYLDAAVSSRLATAGYTAPLNASATRAAVGLGAADLDTQLNSIYTVAGRVQAKTDNLPSDPADASDISGSFSTVNSTLATIAGYLDTEIAAIKAKTDNLPTIPAARSDVAGLLSTQLADAYAANGTAPTLQQALMAIHQHLMHFGIAGTSRTVKKLDGTTAFVETLDSSTAPTALSRG